MPLKLVLGPANSAKAGEVLGAYAAAARRDAVLVVPTATDVAHYQRELAGQQVVFGSVLTFSGLARELAARAGYAGRRLTARQRELLLRRLAGRLDFTTLAESARAAGFAAAAGELIAELERSLVTPQRFAAALKAWAAAEVVESPGGDVESPGGDSIGEIAGGRFPRSGRGDYARDLAALYREYTAELDRRGRVDTELFAWRALDALRARPGAWGSTPVFFYGFDDLLAIERDAIETLARIVGVDVVVSLTFEPGRTALGARAGAVQELRAIATTVAELPAADEHYQPAAREALHHLERNLFEIGSGPRDPGETVRLLEAGGERAEAELVAGKVLDRLRAGVPASEIVVVCRSLARTAPLLELVFERYGIPVAGHRRVSLVQTALGRAVLALARCALLEPGEAGAHELLTYLRAPGRVERLELVDALEADVRREGLLSAAQARERLGWKLEEIDALRAAADPAGELARQARRLLAAPHRGGAPLLDQLEELDARALAEILAALTELEDLGERLEGAELIELLETLELRPGPPRGEETVLLAEPLGIRARRFRAVFVCGLCEGEFPLAGAGEPFLSDERRRELALASGLRLAPREDTLALERYLFYSAVSRATESVAFSYRSSDEEGNLVLASPFVTDLVELFGEPWRERRRRRLLADVTWSPGEAPTQHERARAQAAARGRDPAARAPRAAVRHLPERAREHIRHRQVVSGGALESFAQCPVKWLVERQLDPTRLEPDSDPMVRGSYMHAVLERVVRRLGRAITPATLGEARELLGQVLAELPGDGEDGGARIGTGRPDGIRAAMRRSIEADLQRYLEYEAGDGCEFVPRGVELRFGFTGEEDDSLPAVTLGEGDQRIALRGVIDRVDVDQSGRQAIVRDYKSGSTRPERQGARWLVERQLQVALYMLAVRELLGLEPVAGLYQPLGGRDLRARGAFRKGAAVGDRVVGTDAREPAELTALLDDAEALATELAATLRAGALEPCPSTCSRDGCRYPGICWSE